MIDQAMIAACGYLAGAFSMYIYCNAKISRLEVKVARLESQLDRVLN